MPTYYVLVTTRREGVPKHPLYLARRYREQHGGGLTSTFSERLIYSTMKGCENRIAFEKRQGKNPIYGALVFTIIEEPDEPAGEVAGPSSEDQAS
jgi:hypothetical protein